MAKPLEGIRVLDNTRALSGPYATFLLTLLGAEVIRIENALQPERLSPPYIGTDGPKVVSDSPDDVSFAAVTRHRGKKSITLNFKDKRTIDIWERLVKESDVVVENYSAGTADALGIGYSRAREVNPRIVYAAISGFGSDPKYNRAPAMDALIQSLSGAMMTSGTNDDPPIRVGFPIADLAAPLFGVIGILAALRERDLSGEGQMVDVSMLGSLTAMMATESFPYFEGLDMEVRTGGRLQRLTPWGVFETADGWVTIIAMKPSWLEGLLDAMNDKDLITDARFASQDLRVKNYLAFEGRIEDWTRTVSTEDVIAQLSARGVPCAAVREPAEAILDPEALERGDVVEIPIADGKASIIGSDLPIRFSRTERVEGLTLAKVGSHTDETLRDIAGYSDEEIAAMRAERLI